jgi:hypothetical protein
VTPGYFVAVVYLASVYIGAFLRYIQPNLSDYLEDLSLVCMLALICLAAWALFRRRWKAFAILVAVLFFSFLPGLGVEGPVRWLVAEGFRIHASPFENYLSRCKLIEFIEDDKKQTVGMCETHSQSYGEFYYTVIYDTTGELLKPVSHRTQAWQKTMSEFYSDDVLNSTEKRTLPILGDFYSVGTILAEERGDDSIR